MYIYMQGAAICHSESGPNIWRFVCLPVCVSIHLIIYLAGLLQLLLCYLIFRCVGVVSPNPTPCEAPRDKGRGVGGEGVRESEGTRFAEIGETAEPLNAENICPS